MADNCNASNRRFVTSISFLISIPDDFIFATNACQFSIFVVLIMQKKKKKKHSNLTNENMSFGRMIVTEILSIEIVIAF